MKKILCSLLLGLVAWSGWAAPSCGKIYQLTGPSYVGNRLVLRSKPSGKAPFTYQWKKDGKVVSTEERLDIPSLSENDYGTYTLTVREKGGASATSKSYKVEKPKAGTVVGWGADGHGRTKTPDGLSGVVQVACGMNFNLALTTNGTVTAWGYNEHGGCNVPFGLKDVSFVAAGGVGSSGAGFAVKKNGTVVGWGEPFEYYDWGEKGGYDTVSGIPASLRDVVQVAVGGPGAIALRSDGSVVVWREAGDFYEGSAISDELADIVSVVVPMNSYDRMYALRADGRVVESSIEDYWDSEVEEWLEGPRAKLVSGLSNIGSIVRGSEWEYGYLALSADGKKIWIEKYVEEGRYWVDGYWDSWYDPYYDVYEEYWVDGYYDYEITKKWMDYRDARQTSWGKEYGAIIRSEFPTTLTYTSIAFGDTLIALDTKGNLYSDSEYSWYTLENPATITNGIYAIAAGGYHFQAIVPDADGDGLTDVLEEELGRDPMDASDGGLAGFLSGTIRGDGYGIDAKVELFASRSGRLFHAAYTDYDGSFAFPSVTPGKYTVKVSAEGYKDVWYDSQDFSGNAQPYTVSGGSHRTNFNFDLEPGQSPAFVRVTSNPSGADIYFNLHPTGLKTPALIDIGECEKRDGNWNPMQSHVISVKGKDWPRLAPRPVLAKEADVVTMHFDRTSEKASVKSVRIESTPRGADVYLDDAVTKVGVTPLSVSVSQKSSGHILLLRKKGYLIPQPIILSKNPGTVKVPLKSISSATEADTISIDVSEANGEELDVYVDYLPAGEVTPILIENLDAASHSSTKLGAWYSASHHIMLFKKGYFFAPRSVDEWGGPMEIDPTVDFILKDIDCVLNPFEAPYNGRAYTVDAIKLGASSLTEVAPTITYSLNSDGPWQTKTFSFTDACTTSIYVKISAPYHNDLIQELSVTVAPKKLTDAMVSKLGNVTYTGLERTPVVSVKDGSKVLKKDKDYTLSYWYNVDAGTAFLTVKGIGNYAGDVVRSFMISTVAMTSGGKEPGTGKVPSGGASIYDMTYTYDGQPHTLNAGALENVLIKGELPNVSYGLSQKGVFQSDPFAITDAGSTTFWYRVALDNYNDYVHKVKVTVKPKKLTADMVADIPAQVYTGGALKPAVAVSDVAGITESDYTVKYANNTKAGTATVTVTGKRNYTGTVTKKFTITAAAMSLDPVDEPGEGVIPVDGLSEFDATYVYDGKAHSLNTTALKAVRLGKSTPSIAYSLTENGKYSSTAISFKNVGETSIWYRLTCANYEPYKHEAKITITPKTLTAAMVANVAPQAYKGVALMPKVTVKDGSALTSKDYTVAYSNNLEAGTAYVVVTGQNNYTGTVVEPFIIYPASMTTRGKEPGSGKVPSGGLSKFDATYTYDGLPHTLKTEALATVRMGEEEPSKSYSLTCDGAFQLEPITFTDVCTTSFWYRLALANGEAYTYPVKVTIKPKKLTSAMVADVATQTYTGSAITPGVDAADVAPCAITADDYTLKYANNVKVGTATVTVTGKRNYTGSVSKKFSIVAAEIAEDRMEGELPEGALSNFDAEYVYDGKSHSINTSKLAALRFEGAKPSLSYSLTENGKYSSTAISFKNVCSTSIWYKVKVSNYKEYKHEAKVVITPKPLTEAMVTIPAQSYNGTVRTPKVTVKDGKTTLKVTRDYTVDFDSYVNAGTYNVSVEGKGNYTGVVTKPFTVKPLVMTTKEPGSGSVPKGGKSKFDTTVVFDGDVHTINLDKLCAVRIAGAAPEIRFALTKEGPYQDEPIFFTDVCTTSIWYSLSMPNYGDYVHEAKITIKPKTLTEDMVSVGEAVFTSSSVEPTVDVYDSDRGEDISTDDYELLFFQNGDVGTGFVAVMAKNNYTGMVIESFEITDGLMMSFLDVSATSAMVSVEPEVAEPVVEEPTQIVILPEEEPKIEPVAESKAIPSEEVPTETTEPEEASVQKTILRSSIPVEPKTIPEELRKLAEALNLEPSADLSIACNIIDFEEDENEMAGAFEVTATWADGTSLVITELDESVSIVVLGAAELTDPFEEIADVGVDYEEQLFVFPAVDEYNYFKVELMVEEDAE